MGAINQMKQAPGPGFVTFRFPAKLVTMQDEWKTIGSKNKRAPPPLSSSFSSTSVSGESIARQMHSAIQQLLVTNSSKVLLHVLMLGLGSIAVSRNSMLQFSTFQSLVNQIKNDPSLELGKCLNYDPVHTEEEASFINNLGWNQLSNRMGCYRMDEISDPLAELPEIFLILMPHCGKVCHFLLGISFRNRSPHRVHHAGIVLAFCANSDATLQSPDIAMCSCWEFHGINCIEYKSVIVS